MVIYTYVQIAGSPYNDHVGCVVDRGTSDFDASSNFTLTLPNPYGRYRNKFQPGQEVLIFAKQGSIPDPMVDTPFFGGYLEDKEFMGQGDGTGQDELTLMGRSYVSILHDAVVAPIVYSDQTVEAIVADLFAREAPEIDASDIDVTGVTLNGKKAFSGVSLYDVAKELAELSDCYFYVDGEKALHFKKIMTSDSGLVLVAGQNITGSIVTESRKPMYNKVWVYGDKMLVDAGKETFTADGGSVYTLKYKPHNVGVFVAGSTVSKQGGILNFVGQGDPGSGTQFLVSYHDKQIVFVSGTDAGMNIPASGSTSFTVEYQRERQIIKYAQDDSSVALYKPKTYWYTDKNIKDPLQAKAVALSLLDRGAHPFKEVNTTYQGWNDFTPGQTAGLYEPYQELSGAQFSIIRAKYDLSPEALQKETVIQLTLNKKLVDGADIIKQALLDIKRIRAENTVDEEIYTRLQVSPGSMGVRVKLWSVATGAIGTSFVLDHPTAGVLGTGSLGDRSDTMVVVYSGADA